ncbi:MAG: hypothetical protein HY556_11210 [Euryarchaeota archaeon]|nr:hypothetical protein [Euryarchaeota archaeon]
MLVKTKQIGETPVLVVGSSPDPPSPPRWALDAYFRLSPPGKLDLATIEDVLGTGTRARQFAHVGVRARLLVRIAQGAYYAVDPSVAIRAWSLSPYWGELLTLNAALSALKIRHAFACLPTLALTSYVPYRAWPVFSHKGAATAPKIDAFQCDAYRSEKRFLSVLGEKFSIPSTITEDAALLFAATGLPREVAAAQEILKGTRIDAATARHFNYFNIRTDPKVFEATDPQIVLPGFLAKRRQALGDELIKESAGP